MQRCAHLVDLEKCCQTHIFCKISFLIQLRTSPPKICKIIFKVCQKQNENFANSAYLLQTSAAASPAMAGPAVHVAGAAIQLPPELIPLIGKILFFPLNYVPYDADENGEFI